MSAGDLVWAYLGPPEHEPPLPDLEFTAVAPAHRFVSKKLQECNWAQACEGALDTAHFSFLHTPLDVPDVPPEQRRHPMANATQVDADDPAPVFHVLRARRRAAARRVAATPTRATSTGASRSTSSRTTAWRPGRRPGDIYFGQTWVPIDDRSCWVYVYTWNPDRPLTEKEDRFIPGMPSVHAEVDERWVPIRNRSNDYLIDREAQRTRSFTGIEGISEQDAAIQDSQGFIADRTREHLGPTDLGIVRFRRTILDAARRLAGGDEPSAANAPHAYRVRGGGIIAPADRVVTDVLTERFGDVNGRVDRTTAAT